MTQASPLIDFQTEDQKNRPQPVRSSAKTTPNIDFQEEKTQGSQAPTGNAGTVEHPLVTPMPGEDFADTMRRGIEMGKHVTQQQVDTEKKEAIRKIPTVIGAASLPGVIGGVGEAALAGKLLPFALRATTGLVGATGGSMIGRYGGRALGGETGEEIGQVGGGLLGGLAGAGAFGEGARQIGNPKRLPFVGRMLPDLLPEAEELDQFGYPSSENPVPAGANRPLYARLPSRIPKIGVSGGSSSLIGASNVAPEEVSVLPEPRSLFPGENPNYAASTPRRELVEQALRSKPGAGTQLQQLGKPIIYKPRGAWDDQ